MLSSQCINLYVLKVKLQKKQTQEVLDLHQSSIPMARLKSIFAVSRNFSANVNKAVWCITISIRSSEKS